MKQLDESIANTFVLEFLVCGKIPEVPQDIASREEEVGGELFSSQLLE